MQSLVPTIEIIFYIYFATSLDILNTNFENSNSKLNALSKEWGYENTP